MAASAKSALSAGRQDPQSAETACFAGVPSLSGQFSHAKTVDS